MADSELTTVQALAPRGFLFSAVAAGIKRQNSDRLDLALVEAPAGAAVAALFTTNRVKAAPLVIGAEHLRRQAGNMHALVVNSGNANCATGPAGLRGCREVCAALARQLGTREQQVFPSSTGVIGMPFPHKRVVEGLPALVSSAEGSPAAAERFARAIMTTDTRPKMAGTRVAAKPREVTLFGVAKGAGMIHPNMATMLAYVFTDAVATPRQLQLLLAEACEESFNAISVDGDTSTNDTLALMASGASEAELNGRVKSDFRAALKLVCSSLAEQIVSDGEGIQHVVRLRVEQAKNQAEARAVANTIATSLLVKTAWAGADPNWGRILAAVGRSGIEVNPARVDIYIGRQQVCRRGVACEFSETEAHRYMTQPSYEMRVGLGRGAASSTILTNDLTAEYVRINADYRT